MLSLSPSRAAGLAPVSNGLEAGNPADGGALPAEPERQRRVTRTAILLGAGVMVVLVAFANAFVMPQTQPRMEAEASTLIGAFPWWALSRGLGPLVPESPRTITLSAAGLQLVAFAAYAIGIAVAWRIIPRRRHAAVIVATTALAWSFTTAALPTLDTDVFSYIAQGRVAAVHDANPEVSPPSAFPDDPLVRFVSPEYRSIPGDNKLPLWSDVTAVVASVAGSGPAGALLDYRLLFLAVDFATLGLLAWILARIAPARLLAGMVVYGWNPIVIETGQSKVDTLMVLLVVASIGLLVSGRARLSIASLVASVLVKLISLPLLVVRLGGEARRRAWKALGADLAVAAAVIAVVYVPFWSGPREIWTEIGLVGSSGSLLPSVLRPLASAGFVAVMLWLIWRDDGSARRLVRSWTIVMLIFGAVLTAPGMSWYLLTMVALAALCADAAMVSVAVAISFVSFAFDRVQRFELAGPADLSRGAAYVGVAGAATAAVIVAVWLERTHRLTWPNRRATR